MPLSVFIPYPLKELVACAVADMARIHAVSSVAPETAGVSLVEDDQLTTSQVALTVTRHLQGTGSWLTGCVCGATRLKAGFLVVIIGAASLV